MLVFNAQVQRDGGMLRGCGATEIERTINALNFLAAALGFRSGKADVGLDYSRISSSNDTTLTVRAHRHRRLRRAERKKRSVPHGLGVSSSAMSVLRPKA